MTVSENKMKKLATLVLGSILLFGSAACDNDTAKTSADAPDSVGGNVENASNFFGLYYCFVCFITLVWVTLIMH